MSADILEPNPVTDLAMHERLRVDEVRETRIQNRRHAVVEGLAMSGLVALLAEELEVLAPEEVTRLGKRRHPRAVLQTRIPADVVEVQVRAHHEVDVMRLQAGARE